MKIKKSLGITKNLRDFYEKDANRVQHFEMYKQPLDYRRAELILKMVSSIARRGDLVLDVGCGDGYYLYHLHKMGYQSVGLDLSRKRVLRARERVKSSLIVGDAAKLPFKPEVFDVIICLEVLEHLPKPKKAVEEIHQILKCDKYAIFSVPSTSNIAYFLKKFLKKNIGDPFTDPGHIQTFNYRRMQKLFRSIGLKIVEVRGIPVIPPKIYNFIVNRISSSLAELYTFFEKTFEEIPLFKRYGVIQVFMCQKKPIDQRAS